MRRTITLALCIISLASCEMSTRQCVDMKFGRLKQADRIDITDNLNRRIRVITDKEQIGQFVAFAQAHDTGWGTPWDGTPIAMIGAQFFAGEKFIGNLDVGSNFLVAQGCGYFQSRSVSHRDRKVIMDLFGVKDPYANR